MGRVRLTLYWPKDGDPKKYSSVVLPDGQVYDQKDAKQQEEFVRPMLLALGTVLVLGRSLRMDEVRVHSEFDPTLG